MEDLLQIFWKMFQKSNRGTESGSMNPTFSHRVTPGPMCPQVHLNDEKTVRAPANWELTMWEALPVTSPQLFLILSASFRWLNHCRKFQKHIKEKINLESLQILSSTDTGWFINDLTLIFIFNGCVVFHFMYVLNLLKQFINGHSVYISHYFLNFYKLFKNQNRRIFVNVIRILILKQQ